MKLKRFIIRDLFGYQTIDMPFDKDVKILIGENGLGKTTFLSTLYFVLNRKYERLSKVNFSSIEIHFDKEKVSIVKEHLLNYLSRSSDERTHFTERLASAPAELLTKLKEIIYSIKITPQQQRLQVEEVLSKMGFKINAPTSYIFKQVIRYFEDIDAENFFAVAKTLKENLNSKILFFPTYRRIEEELKNIGVISRKELIERYGHFLDEDYLHKIDDEVIQFGMGDVEERIKSLTTEIAQSSVVGFSEITGEMLHQLLTEFPDVRPNKGSKQDIEKIKIVLRRVGSSITEEDKIKIIESIESGKTANKGLLFFITKLIELYKKQEEIDTSIKNFVNVCNKYLRDKKYVYDEREVSLRIRRTLGKEEEVQLNQLSSGEKQIVSLFSKIYLERDSDYIVLFDEPELSLSLPWQMQLLPDIIESGKCKLLIAVTHSPFIFENELSEFAVGLEEYITAKI